MNSYDSSANFDISAEGSQLLDFSAALPSDSSSSRQRDYDDDDDYGHGHDLSLSDLSMEDQTIRMSKPFSLLSQPTRQKEPSPPPRSSRSKYDDHRREAAAPSSRLVDPEDEQQQQAPYEYEDEPSGNLTLDYLQADHKDEEEEAELDEQELQDRENARRQAEKMRDEKLQNDIFILKKLNAAFETFNGALDEAGSANHRVAEQLVETDALLNKYISILSKSEDFARLIFDEQWQGAEADERQIRQEQEAAERREREAARERALAEQRERERQEREEQERAAREEKARLERDKKERAASRGGVRGVRGTRASMRGMRGSAPPSSRPESSTSMRPRASVAPGATGIPVKRGVSSTTGRGVSRRP